jgi:hypothetical protein
MPTLSVRKAAILFKIESVEGTDAAPSASTDGVLVENLRMTFNPIITETNEVTPSLDPFDPIVGGMSVTTEFDVYLKGSGAAGTAPEFGKLLKACGFAETITGSAIPASPEALASGSSTTQATLGASASSTAELYRGMPISVSGTQTIDSFIADYSAAKLAKITDTAGGNLTTTSNYQIPINVLYTPASASISSGTLWWYNDGILYKVVGNRGNVSFSLTSGGPGRMSFRFMGAFESKTDAAMPAVSYDSTRPPIWKAGAFTINAAQAAGQSLTLDMGSQITQPDNPNASEGFDPAIITARQPRGSINPKESLVATRDIMADFRAQTRRSIHARFGTTAGNRVALTIPAGLYLNQTPADRNGYRVAEVPFHATGQDAGAFLAIY